MNQGSSIPPPTPGDFIPPGESTSGAIGTDVVMFARADHQHPRLTSATNATTDANGEATIVFTRTFASAPAVSVLRIPPVSGAPCVFDVISWTTGVGGIVTGCVIKGYRLSGPQNLAAVTVVGISVAIGGQTIVTYGPAASVAVCVVGLQNSGT